jgi:predicted transcriptional regulator
MSSQPLNLKPERRAELEEYARLHDQSPEEALDDLLATQLAWERQECEQTFEAVRRGYEDVKAGRTKPAGEVHEAMRRKYGF